MSERYPGGVITKNAIVPTPSSAPGVWTLDQQLQAKQAGTWPFGGPFVYIEDVFSTWLYTGNGSTQTITNGIDLSTYGGLVWIKDRNTSYGHYLFDTIRGGNKSISSNSTSAQNTQTNNSVNFLSSGFSVDNVNQFSQNVNLGGGNTYASWTFRKQPKFFDVVTFTTDSSTNTNQRISHSLGSVPGCIIVKLTGSASGWFVNHRSLSSSTNSYIRLDSQGAADTSAGIWGTSGPTSTDFGISTGFFGTSQAAVAYVFAHNAGGFGLTGTDNVISCGSFTTDGSGQADVNLGYQPQWIMYKRTDGAGNWVMVDTMRGWMVDTASVGLIANGSAAEPVGSPSTYMRTLGFNVSGSGGQSFIYIAIRRGPMKTPTSGTSVYNGITRTGTGATATVTGAGFPPDLLIAADRSGYVVDVIDKLRGPTQVLTTVATVAENWLGGTSGVTSFNMNGLTLNSDGTYLTVNNTGVSSIEWLFQRAPGFFDEVCYTGDGTGGSGRAITHNLGVAPELVIVKSRSNAYDWRVWQTSFGTTYNILLNSSAAQNANFYLWANTYLAVTNPTTQFGVYGDGTTNSTNTSGATYVAYLFASCPGVSKVGSYTGNGSTQTINCGFTGGARFVLIKRTDASGDWYVYDTARGMTTLTDPYLLLNSTAAESATLGSVTTVSTGFALNASILAAINTNGASYIFLAIA